MLLDLRFALRMLARSPGFTAVALLTLALGIGANTAVYSVVNAILLRPPAYPDSGKLVVIKSRSRQEALREQASPADLKDWRERNRSFEGIAVYDKDSVTLQGGDAERVDSASISANLLSVLRVNPILGRAFQPEDERPGAPFAILISSQLWRNRFGSDPAIAGKTLLLEGTPVTVAGVMPPGFAFPDPTTALWLPMRIGASQWNRRNVYYLRTIARLKRGVTLVKASEDMTGIARNLAAEYPATNTGLDVAVVTLRKDLAAGSDRMVWVIVGAVGFVLLIVCANLANLLLARTSGRAAELSIRAALGAGRARIARQMLIEGLALSVLGGIAGVLVAAWAIEGIRVLAQTRLARAAEIQMDAGALTFNFLLAALTGILFCLAPAWEATRAAARDALSRTGARALPRTRSLRRALVTIEVALALVLLIGAGLLLRSFWQLRRVQPGFQAADVLTFRIYPPMHQFRTRKQLAAFYEDILGRIRGLDGVAAAGAVGNLPISGQRSGTGIAVENRPSAQGEELTANYQLAGPGYFQAMGVPIVRGRDFNEGDGQPGAAEAVIINQALAARCLPGEDPIGRRIRLGPNPNTPFATIVGVVGDIHHDSLAQAPRPEVYENYFQHAWGSMSLVVRARSDLAALAPAVRTQIKLANKDVPAPPMSTLEEVLAASLADRRFIVMLLSAFAGAALVLAAIGVYGVLAFAVTQRRREIGIRIALGGQPAEVAGLVAREGVAIAGIGIGLGGLSAFVLTRFLSALLFEVTPADPLTYAVAALALVIAAIAAAYLPARRAARIDPAITLRYE